MIHAQRVKIPKGSTHHRVSQGHGTHVHPWSQCSLVLCQLHLLSLVWEGGAKWGNSGKPFKDNPLQARPCVQPVFWLPNNDVGLSPLAWMPKLSKISSCIWIRHIHLTYPLNQEFLQRSKGRDIQLDPLPPEGQKVAMKVALPASLPNPSFVL